MDSNDVRKKFLDFFKNNKHEIISSSSLIPDDPSVLLTTAGMQQFKKYYSGTPYPFKNSDSVGVVSTQKCFRTSDIGEVGDDSHLTFFEMLGNFSFGEYFKKEAIKLAYEFITKELGLEIDYVSVFDPSTSSGQEALTDVPADTESEEIWKSLGVANIKHFGREDNFWGPTGTEGPCGPTSEIYVKPSTSSGQAVEVWNLVFNQYYQKADKSLELLKQNGIDTGMGLERLAMMVQNKKNIFETDLFAPILSKLPVDIDGRKKRIIADHLRAIAFLVGDGIRPSNKEAGYILRRLMRRSIVYGMSADLKDLLNSTVDLYKDFYNDLNKEIILEVFEAENSKFKAALLRGTKELEKFDSIDPASAFWLYESYGLPFEIIKDKFPNLSREEFEAEFKKHQEISRAGVEKKFGGHGMVEGDLTASDADELKIKTRLHTATHLLNSALHKVLGDSVSQRGSDITAERARFDFVFERKMTSEEIQKVEELVNDAISKNIPVTMEELPTDEAKKSDALFFYKGNYGDVVKVYTIGDFSREICGGPHVSNTGEIGKFRIIKEESSSAGIRRIRAVVE